VTTIYDEGRKVSLDAKDKVTVTRTLRVTPYLDSKMVAETLLGAVATGAGTFTRRPPARDPWHLFAFAKSINIDGLGVYGSGNPSGTSMLDAINGYSEGARLTVTYETRDAEESQEDDEHETDEDEEIDLAKESWNLSAKQITLPLDYYCWENFRLFPAPDPAVNGKNLEATKTIQAMEFSLTRLRVPRVPFLTISKLLGKVNEEAFTSRLYFFPPETMLFDSVSTNRSISWNGVKEYELTYKFKIMPVYDLVYIADEAEEGERPKPSGALDWVGWNRLYDHSIGMWRKIVPTRFSIYDWDTLGNPAGFKALFNPRAS
jgi:hypothetical protein